MEQTSLSRRIKEESQENTESDNPRSGNPSPSGNTTDGDGQRSELDKLRDSGIDDWIAEREAHEESYGYFHLFVVAESSLTGIERHLRYEYEINHPGSDESQSTLHTRFGMGGSRPETVRDQIISWKLSKLAIPLHPELRDVPANQLRVFVADPAREVLRKQDVEVDSVVEELAQMDEHFPSKKQIMRTYRKEEAKFRSGGKEKLWKTQN